MYLLVWIFLDDDFLLGYGLQPKLDSKKSIMQFSIDDQLINLIVVSIGCVFVCIF